MTCGTTLIGKYNRVIVTLLLSFFLLAPIFLSASGSDVKSVGNQQLTVLHYNHIQSAGQNFVATDQVGATQSSVMRSGKKMLKPMRLVVSKIVVTILNLSPETFAKAPEYIHGSSVFEIIPCYQQFLQIGSLLI